MKKLLKNKKNIGIASILAIVIMVSGIVYYQSGFKDLRKNDTESVFAEESEENQEVVEETTEKSKGESDSSKKNTDSSNKINTKEKMIVVEIKGEVNKPEVYTMEENSIVKDLIDKAGGLTAEADVSNINRAKKLQDHEVIYINNKQEVTQGVQVNTPVNQNNSNDKININTATVEDLKKLNGIGDSKAQSMIQYREENGGFKSIEDVKNVTGIGEKMFEKIKDKITT